MVAVEVSGAQNVCKLHSSEEIPLITKTNVEYVLYSIVQTLFVIDTSTEQKAALHTIPWHCLGPEQ